MKLYAVSYRIDGGDSDGYMIDFFSRKTDAFKKARELHAGDDLLFDVRKIRVPTKKADMIEFLNSVNYGIILGEIVPWGGE
tara:strand:- start:5297 stop:5539 length:243 start_codon:yes stop_codon:yes gene_type:complete